MKIDDELARKLAKLTTAFAKDMEKQRKQVPGPEVPPEEAKKAESEESETLEACGAEVDDRPGPLQGGDAGDAGMPALG